MSQRLSFGFARRHGVMLDLHAPQPCLLIREGLPLNALGEARRVVGAQWPLRRVDAAQFSERLAACYSSDQDEAQSVAQGLDEELDLSRLAQELPQTCDLLEQQDDAPIIRLLNALLSEAVRTKASDIHLETFENDLRVRLRVDGMLREVLRPRRELASLLVSRIKVMARLDIAEKRVPQDGRLSLRLAGHEVDVRVSTLPSAHGERVVMRLLDRQAVRLDLEALNMRGQVKADFQQVLQRPHGIFLVTGPTGSGKTTTLYTALSVLNDSSRNILTVEDPIEFHLPGIGQTQVNPKVEMTFARGLRAILRQDPDVVMVGEIRDQETAQVAVQASLTGHLVVSTLHTSSAVGAITRLLDIGVDRCLLAASLTGVLAQRLVRALCPRCRIQTPVSVPLAARLNDASLQCVFSAQGCEDCLNGYIGRLGVYEMVLVTPAMAELIHAGAAEAQLTAHARQHSASLFENGLELVRQGRTSIEELLRVTVQEQL